MLINILFCLLSYLTVTVAEAMSCGHQIPLFFFSEELRKTVSQPPLLLGWGHMTRFRPREDGQKWLHHALSPFGYGFEGSVFKMRMFKTHTSKIWISESPYSHWVVPWARNKYVLCYYVKLPRGQNLFVTAYNVPIGTKEVINTTLNLHFILLQRVNPEDFPYFTKRYIVFCFLAVS